jgi:CRISPR-associated protein Csm4
MKIYAITIKPESPIGTPLKGDTLFGHFCWQAVGDDELLDNGFDHWIKLYPERPFAVFSSAWPQVVEPSGTTVYYLPKPVMPTLFQDTMSRKERAENRKLEKAKKWLPIEENSLNDLASCRPINDRELFERHLATLADDEKRLSQGLPENQQKPIITVNHAHNSINRQTMTTGKGFDPFSMDNFHYLPGLELVVFAALDEDALDMERLCKGLKNIGRFGFGRDATTGLGRFSLGAVNELDWPRLHENQGCYTLAPCVPEPNQYSQQFALPFTRFGRHGDQLVLSKHPYKNPIVMADEGAVFYPENGLQIDRPYIGTAVTGLSLAEKNTVAQGYSLYLPLSRRTS